MGVLCEALKQLSIKLWCFVHHFSHCICVSHREFSRRSQEALTLIFNCRHQRRQRSRSGERRRADGGKGRWLAEDTMSPRPWSCADLSGDVFFFFFFWSWTSSRRAKKGEASHFCRWKQTVNRLLKVFVLSCSQTHTPRPSGSSAPEMKRRESGEFSFSFLSVLTVLGSNPLYVTVVTVAGAKRVNQRPVWWTNRWRLWILLKTAPLYHFEPQLLLITDLVSR